MGRPAVEATYEADDGSRADLVLPLDPAAPVRVVALHPPPSTGYRDGAPFDPSALVSEALFFAGVELGRPSEWAAGVSVVYGFEEVVLSLEDALALLLILPEGTALRPSGSGG